MRIQNRCLVQVVDKEMFGLGGARACGCDACVYACMDARVHACMQVSTHGYASMHNANKHVRTRACMSAHTGKASL